MCVFNCNHADHHTFHSYIPNIVCEPPDLPHVLHKKKRVPLKDEWQSIFNNPLSASTYSRTHRRGWDSLLHNLEDVLEWLFSRCATKSDHDESEKNTFRETVRENLKSGIWGITIATALYSKWNSYHDAIINTGEGAWTNWEECDEYIVGTVQAVLRFSLLFE